MSAVLAILPFGAAHADGLADTLMPFAVHVRQTPVPIWGDGAGVYLGRGVFITAAHVVGRSWWTKPRIVVQGSEFPTTTVKEGSFEGVDVTLLSVDENLLPMRLQLRHMTLCNAAPIPGQSVVTVVPGMVVRARIIAPERLPPSARRYSTVIDEVARTGNSGSGVFDDRLGCLMGIMSRKIMAPLKNAGVGGPTHDIAKYFVPANEIKAFLPPNMRGWK